MSWPPDDEDLFSLAGVQSRGHRTCIHSRAVPAPCASLIPRLDGLDTMLVAHLHNYAIYRHAKLTALIRCSHIGDRRVSIIVS